MLSLPFQADGYPDIKMNVKFVQDTSKYWYKPDISREQGDSQTYPSLRRPLLNYICTSLLIHFYNASSHQPAEGQGARGLHHQGQPFFPWGLRPGHEGCVPPANCPAEQER